MNELTLTLVVIEMAMIVAVLFLFYLRDSFRRVSHRHPEITQFSYWVKLAHLYVENLKNYCGKFL
jgi:hypothetical protein